MKLRKIINEIGNTINYPDMQVGWGGGKAYFNIDNDRYEIKIKVGDDYDEGSGVIRIPEIGISFKQVGQDNWNQTNKNVPLKVVSYVIGALDLVGSELIKRSKDVNEIRINSLIFETNDDRRMEMYKKFIQSYALKNKINVEFKKIVSDGTYRATFIPYLSTVKK